MRTLSLFVVLLATLVSQGTAQLPFGPVFQLSQYQTSEGQTIIVRLSAPILTRDQTPAFTGTIQVDVTAEDGSAQFGSDYVVDLQNVSSRTFTVTFQSKQANSTEHMILISDDMIVEGTEDFLLRIDAVRFTEQASVLFRPSDGLNNIVADVFIADDDFVEVSWIISDPIEVNEGNQSQMFVTLRAQAFGFYASPIAIGVVCAEVIATGVPPAYPDRDFFVINGSSLLFADVETLRTTSRNELVLLIFDDNITEPCESFICTLQGGAVDRVRGVEPNRVTVRICDDDELIVRWAQDVYMFSESQIAGTVELVTDSTFEVEQVSIQGFPKQIPDGDPNRFPTLVVPGPAFPGFAFDSTIERVFVRVPTTLFGLNIFGNAQVTQSGRSDAVNTINDFVFTPDSRSAFENFTIVDDDVLEFDEIFIAEFTFGPEITNNWNARQAEPITAFIQIRDDDSVEVNFNENSYTVAESDGQVSVSLRIDGKFFIPVLAVVEISDGTATDPEDYSSAGRYNVTFRQTAFTDVNDPDPTTLSSPILINITNDDFFEGVEYFQARIVETSDRFRVRIGQDTVNITITDSVTVRYEQPKYPVPEENGSVTLALVLDGEASVPVTVTVRTLDLLNSSYGDAATADVDYTPRGPFEITFPARSTRQEYTVNITDDFLPENSEFFNADIVSAGPEGVIIGEPRQPVIEILDTFDAVVAISLDSMAYSIFENEEVVTVTLTLNATYQEDIEVNVTVGELLGIADLDRAQADIDFSTAGFPRQVTIPSGQTTVQFNISAVDELIVERDEQFQVSFTYSGGQPGVVVRPGFDEANITIRNDDALIVRFQNNSYSVREDAGSLTYRVIANGTASFGYNITITGADGSATCGSDYHEPVDDSSGTDPPVTSCSYSLTITIPAGSSAGDGVVAIINDTIYEGPENFFLNLSVAQTFQDYGINEGSPLRATVEIEDEDAVVAISLNETAYSIFENEQVVTVTLTLNDTYHEDIVVNVTVGELLGIPDLERAQAGVDFFTAGFPRQVTIPAGQTTVQFNISVRDELIVERDEQFQVSFTYSGGQPGVVVRPGFDEANITIENDDALRVMFQNDSYSVREDAGSLLYSVIATSTASFDYNVTITGEDGSATCGFDYNETIDDSSGTDPPVMSCSYSLTITISAGSSTGDGVVAIINDAIYEGPENFFLNLSVAQTFQAVGINEGSPLRATVQIEDEDELRVFFAPATYSVPEGENQVLVLRTDKDFEVPFTIDVTLEDGTAVAPDDYENRSYQVVFNVTTQTGTLVVHTETDNIIENDEDFTAVLSVPAGLPRVFEGTPSEATVTILDRTTAEVYFDPASYNVTEGQPADLILRLTRDVDPSVTIIVRVQTRDGSATDGADYTGGLYTATFSGSSTTSVRVPTLSDNVLEGLEYFTGVIQVPPDTTANYRVTAGSPNTSMVNIIDATIAGVYFDPDVYMVNEGDNVTLILKTNVTVNKRFSVLVNTSDNSATSPADYLGGETRAIFEIGSNMTTVVYSTVNDSIREGIESFIAELTVPPEMQAMGIVAGMPDSATVNIIDDEELVCMLVRTMHEVGEDMGPLVAMVMCSVPSDEPFTLIVQTSDGTAVDGQDYTGGDYRVTFPAGSTKANFSIPITDDVIFETDETFFLTLVIPQPAQDIGVMRGDPFMATVTIIDDDELRVFFDPADYSVPEGENQVLVLRTDNEFAVPFTVDVTLRDGTAVAPGDYEDRSYQVVFNVTTQTGTLVVHTETDNIIENDEDFTAVLSVPAGLPRVFEGTPSEATVTILDQTTAEVYFDPATYNVTEGQPADLILRLTRDVDPSVNITVLVQTMNGSATESLDYPGGLYTATFSGSSTTSVPCPTLPDDVLEGLEYFTGVIQVPPETTTNYRVTAGSPDTAMVNIIDATIAGVYFDPNVYMVNEGDNVTLILKTNVTVNKRFSVLVTTYDGSANSPADYQGGERHAIFEIGSNMAAVVYSTVNDSIREGIESFIANLTVPPEMKAMGIVPGMPDSVTVNIIDDEVLVCMLVRNMHEVREDMGPLVAMVMCSIPSDEPFTLIVQTSDDTAVDGEDYTGGDYSVFFPAGSTKESFSIPITDDDIFELDETFFLTLVIPRPAQDIGVMRGVPFMATVTIINDEPTVTIDIEKEVIDVIENQTFVEVCLVKSGPSSLPIMALVNADELTGNAGSPVSIDATSQVDFEPDVPEIILAPSEIRKCTNVTIIDDKIVERREPFEVIITFPPGQPALQIGEIVPNATQINGTISIIDDDVITVEFAQNMSMVDESDGMVDVTVITSGRTSFTYTFTVTPMDRTATNNFDYLYPNTTYSFGPTDDNEPIPSLIISIPIINDGDNEFDEDFKLTLEVSADGEAANVTEGPISMTVVLIKDDDDVTVTFSPQNYTVTEGDPAPLMIILDKPAAKNITVTVTTMDITATDTDDYIGGPFDVSIPAGSVKVTLNVSTLPDNIVELPEYFKATLSLPGAPEGCVVGTPDMSYITIIDDTPMIPVWFNPANYSVKEGVDGNAVITLEAGDHNFDFTVIVNSQDGTAFNGSDYIGGPFEVTFPAGVNMVSFNVPILDDAIAECAKLFNLDLDIPAAAAGMGVIRGSPDTATVHIMDDDVEELRLSIENADYMVKENVGSFVAAVIASGPADFEYTVTVETSDDTAVDADDFVSQQYTLTFPAGQTRAEFTVAITDDNVLEAMESFQLLLSIPQDLISKGVQVGPNSAATVTIMDNDVQVKFSQSSVATTEEEGRVLVTVEAMGDLSSDFSIIVMAINGTAVEPFDFTGNMWPVDFLANQASASFEISIVQDNLPETREEFSLKIVIENPYDERVTVVEPRRLTVVITDRKNDTVRGDPLFSIPLPSKYTDHTELQSIQLCFEIHGEAGKHYNLISDACTSVSAQYKQGENDAGLNVISNIGVKAQESSGSCHEIEVDLVGCSAQLDGTLLNTSVTVNGISIMIRRQRVRVSVPNCASSTRLTMWMMCMRRNNEDMLELVVARGDGLDPTAHGLIGQFWNIPVNITSYTGPYGDGTAVASDRIYSVTVAYPNATERTFIADYGKKDWLDGRPCLYAGNHNGGPIGEVKDSGSVIQGKYSNYEVADLFATNYTFSKFKANC